MPTIITTVELTGDSLTLYAERIIEACTHVAKHNAEEILVHAKAVFPPPSHLPSRIGVYEVEDKHIKDEIVLKEAGEGSYTVGGDNPVLLYIEEGTRNMQAQPWLAPAVIKQEPIFHAEVAEAITKALK